MVFINTKEKIKILSFLEVWALKTIEIRIPVSRKTFKKSLFVKRLSKLLLNQHYCVIAQRTQIGKENSVNSGFKIR